MRRHPQKGCTCTTCENSRAYSREKRQLPPDYYKKRYSAYTEAQYAQRMKTQRARRRRLAEARDLARLEDLARRPM